MVRWRGPWRTSSYRVLVDTKHDRAVSADVVKVLFDAPLPSLVLTGNGIWNDRIGSDAHFVRHACTADSRATATAMVSAVLPKVFIIEYERARTRADICDWLRRSCAADIERSSSSSASDSDELLLPAGASLVVGYEPRASRIRIAWPDRSSLDLHGEDAMRGIWSFYFESRERPALAQQLMRWS